MNCGIYTYHALKTSIKKRFFWSKEIEVTEVVGTTQASNWMWASLHLSNLNYDQLVKVV